MVGWSVCLKYSHLWVLNNILWILHLLTLNFICHFCAHLEISSISFCNIIISNSKISHAPELTLLNDHYIWPLLLHRVTFGIILGPEFFQHQLQMAQIHKDLDRIVCLIHDALVYGKHMITLYSFNNVFQAMQSESASMTLKDKFHS